MDQKNEPTRTQKETAARKAKQRRGRPLTEKEAQRIALAAVKRLRKGNRAD